VRKSPSSAFGIGLAALFLAITAIALGVISFFSFRIGQLQKGFATAALSVFLGYMSVRYWRAMRREQEEWRYLLSNSRREEEQKKSG